MVVLLQSQVEVQSKASSEKMVSARVSAFATMYHSCAIVGMVDQ